MNCYFKHWNLEAAKKLGHKPTFIENLIYLRSSLIHTEFQFSERYGSISFSFTLADGVNGARFKMIGYSTPEIWVVDEVAMTDHEEDLAWREACRLSDCNPMFGLGGGIVGFLTPEQALGLTVYLPNEIYQGRKHWKYDTVGLLTFANDTPYGGKDNPVFNVLRPCLAGPLGILEDIHMLRPDPKKAWCSEGGTMVYYAGKKIVPNKTCPRPDKLHPQGCHEFLRKSGLAIN